MRRFGQEQKKEGQDKLREDDLVKEVHFFLGEINCTIKMESNGYLTKKLQTTNVDIQSQKHANIC